jgi:hypothetical protein
MATAIGSANLVTDTVEGAGGGDGGDPVPVVMG